MTDARAAVTDLRSNLWRLAQKRNLTIAASGHPPLLPLDRPKISKGDRYKVLVEDMQQIARANLIFGLHVHVGIPDRETAIQVMNMARYFLPHLFALSTNSPFWNGRNTGLQELPGEGLQRFPRTGIPDAFESLAEYNDYLACSSRPAASTTRRRSGGTSASTPSSTPSSFASATSRCGSTRRSP